MTNRLLIRTETQQGTTRQQRAPRILVLGIIGLFAVVGLGLLAVPILVGTNAFFAASAGCSGQQTGTAGQPPGGAKAKSIPADFLSWYKKVGQQYGVPWTILAGIGTVESDNGRSTRPARRSTAWPPTRTATGRRACTTPPMRSRARPSTCSSSVSSPTRRRR